MAISFPPSANEQLLTEAREKNADPNKIHRLIHKEGADPDCRNQDGLTPLNLAAKAGNTETMEILRTAGAEVNTAAADGTTPLHYAALEGHTDAVRFLLLHDANVTAMDANGQQPVHFAALKNRTAIIRLLAKAPGFEANPLSKQGLTPLGALTMNDDDMAPIKSLLDAGADPHSPYDADLGACPYEWARDNEGDHMVKLFEKYDGYTPPVITDELNKQAVIGTKPALLDVRQGWAEFPTICRLMEKQGTPLTKADLLATSAEGSTYLTRGVECFKFDQILNYLHERSDPLTASDLLEKDGSANALFTTIIEHQSLPELFRLQDWRNRDGGEFKSLWRAVPAQEKSQLNNVHALMAEFKQGQDSGRSR